MPARDSDWARYPSLGELFPWQSPGVKANRTWVIAPDPDILQHRWETLTGSSPDQRDTLLKATRDRTADSVSMPLPGRPQSPGTLRAEMSRHPQIVPYAYRSFDRQYLILDTRVIDYPRPDLWTTEGPRQVFISEPHTNVIDDGPGLTFTATVPDMDCFQGHHGGRVLPLYRDAAGTIPNITPGLLSHLQEVLSREVNAEDLLAYVAAVVAHPGYTRLFREDLAIPGIRVPLSADHRVWDRAITIGRQVLSLHTFATRYAVPAPHQLTSPRPPEPDGPRIVQPIPYTAEEMPDTVRYDEQARAICIGGTGQVGPVPAAVWEYRVGGMRVAEKWIRYRLKNPRGRPAASPLNTINATTWSRPFNDDLLSLLHVLGQVVRLEPAQNAVLTGACSGPVIDTLQLRESGVLPVADSARRRWLHATASQQPL